LLPYFFHLLESIVGNVSALAEKYASHLIQQCPVEVKEEILKFEKEQNLLRTAEIEKTKGEKPSSGSAEKNTKGKSSAKKGANQTGYSDDENESNKTQYLEVNKKHNTELIACK
jgi:hypothetical protein